MSRRIIIDELEFEVPYGKLAAKTYHEEEEDSKRILAIHGWMDNSGSFDHLIPLLKHEKGLYVVCLELPGHGRSNQLPAGAIYSDMSMVLEMRRCIRELNWNQPIDSQPTNGQQNPSSGAGQKENVKKFSIIGHSWGGGLSCLYASLFPDDVEEVICIDFIKSRTIDPDQILQETAKTIDQFIDTVPSVSPFSSPDTGRAKFSQSGQKIKSPDKGQVVVSQETAIIATIDAHIPMGSISREDAICLLKRSTVAVSTPPNSVLYSRDLRLHSLIIMRDHVEINKIIFARAKCHALFILTKEGLYKQDEFIDNYDTMVEFYKSKAKSCHVQWMNADHYIHMTHARKTADIINEYLTNPTGYKVFEDC